MKSLFSIGVFSLFLLQACGQARQEPKTAEKPRQLPDLPAVKRTYSLSDYLKEEAELAADVEKLFASLDDTAIVAQLIMPAVGRLGQSNETILQLIQKRQIGGVLMLNGTRDEFSKWIANYNELNKQLGNPGFLYSSDAEPSLVNRKIAGSTPVKKANELKSIDEVRECAATIANDLKTIGINYNFAPVVDMSPNKTVGFRSFGAVPANIIPWSDAFIQETQKNGIIATAKHFPGHGLVSGDTHKALQVIDGELKEVPNYPKLIEDGVLSIMIGHLAVKNNPKYNTNGLPSTLSPVIVTDLLRKELHFQGLVVTDAMNMGGVTSVGNANVKAVQAGVDIVLMPLDAAKAHAEVLAKYRSDAAFKARVDESARRILRMKLCVGAIR